MWCVRAKKLMFAARALTRWVLTALAIFYMNVLGCTTTQDPFLQLEPIFDQVDKQINEGRLDEAVALANKALNRAQELHAKDGIAIAMAQLGMIHGLQGPRRQGAEELDRALQYASESGNEGAVFMVLMSRINFRIETRDLAGAQDDFKRLEPLAKAAGAEGECRLFFAEANYVLGAGLHDQVEQTAQKALTTCRKANAPGLVNSLEMIQAIFYLKTNQPQRAMAALESMPPATAASDRWGFLCMRGLAELWLHKDAEAESDLKQALTVAEDVVWPRGEWQTRFCLGMLRMRQERWNDAVTVLYPAIQLIEGERYDLSASASQLAYFADAQDVYDLMISALVKIEQQDKKVVVPESKEGLDPIVLIFMYSEMTRARVFFQQLHAAMPEAPPVHIPPEIAAEEKELTARLRAIEEDLRELSAEPNPDQSVVATLQQEHFRLNVQVGAFLQRLFENYPAYAAARYPAALFMGGGLKIKLKPDEVMISYKVLEWGTVAEILLPNDDMLFHFVSLERSDLSVKIDKAWIDMQTGSNEWQRSASLLYDKLLAPLMSVISNYRRWIIIPDRDLARLPFEALGKRDASGWHAVNQDHAIIYQPSEIIFASNRKSLAARLAFQWPRTFLGFGDPIYSQNDSRITGAKDEECAQSRRGKPQTAIWNEPRLCSSRIEVEQAKAIALTLGRPSDSFFDNQASVAQVRLLNAQGRLKDYRILHFAVHGALGGDLPDLNEPALLLARPAKTEDGILRMSDVMKLKMSADVAVLSACSTGAGAQVRGEGVVAMTRAFMYAGARSVVVSVWNVPDRSTGELMTKFYHFALEEGKDKAEALRLAREDIRKKYDGNPYYWAPFVIYGEP